MPKTLQSYGGFSSLDIKNRASNTCDMVVVGSTVDCTNISVTRVKNVLGSASTAVGGLCTEALVNKWSGFGPREWVVNTYPAMVNEIKVPYMLGSFAGYDHGAVEPVPFNSSFEYTQGATGSTITQSIAAKVKMGQYDWGKLGGTHAKIIVYDSGNAIYSQSGILPINGAGNFITFDNVSFTFPTGVVGETTYTTKVYICSSDGSEIAELPIYGNVTCTIIAATAYILTVKVNGNVKTFTMQGTANTANADYIARTGKYTGNGTVDGKVLNNITYELLNKTTNAVESLVTVTTFNAVEFPTMLSDLMVNDLENFSVASQYGVNARFTSPTATQYARITMNYV